MIICLFLWQDHNKNLIISATLKARNMYILGFVTASQNMFNKNRLMSEIESMHKLIHK